MKTLNLTSPETSDIKFEVSHFPDGQQDVRILTPKTELGHYDEEAYWIAKPVTIKSRFNTFQDLELIIAATEALKGLGAGNIKLYIPYLLGARSDRRFKEGGTSYLVEVVAPILNAQGYRNVTTLDAHSDVAAACINDLHVIDNVEFVLFALSKIIANSSPLPASKQALFENLLFISPDGGSLKKIFHVADAVGYQGPVVTCSKLRDWEGKLSRIEVPLLNGQIGRDYFIIDDLCDGGRTFIGIAERLKLISPESKIYLAVTHGVFSAGLDGLLKYFDGIYCTNSYKDLSLIMPGNYKVHQLNVF